jgi:hypothetical protein
MVEHLNMIGLDMAGWTYEYGLMLDMAGDWGWDTG